MKFLGRMIVIEEKSYTFAPSFIKPKIKKQKIYVLDT